MGGERKKEAKDVWDNPKIAYLNWYLVGRFEI